MTLRSKLHDNPIPYFIVWCDYDGTYVEKFVSGSSWLNRYDDLNQMDDYGTHVVLMVNGEDFCGASYIFNEEWGVETKEGNKE
jgi:hypothetical protein